METRTYADAKAAVDIPAVEKAGADAYRAGVSSYDCPYPYGTAIGDVWWGGWFAARAGRA